MFPPKIQQLVDELEQHRQRANEIEQELTEWYSEICAFMDRIDNTTIGREAAEEDIQSDVEYPPTQEILYLVVDYLKNKGKKVQARRLARKLDFPYEVVMVALKEGRQRGLLSKTNGGYWNIRKSGGPSVALVPFEMLKGK